MRAAPEKIAVRTAVTVLAVNLFVLALAALVLQQSRVQHEARGTLTTQNLAELLRHNIADHFDLVDAVFDATAAADRRLQSSRDPTPAALQETLRRAVLGEASLAGLWLLDAQGQVRAGYALPRLAPAARPAALDASQLAPCTESNLTIVGLAAADDPQGRGILVARRLAGQDGRLSGYLLGQLPPEPLRQMFSALKLGHQGSIALRDPQWRLLLRDPQQAGALAPGSVALSDDLRRALLHNAQAGSFSSDNAGRDAVPRLYSYRRHERYGFLVNVGLAYDDFLLPWWRELQVLTAAAAGFILVTGLFGWSHYRTACERHRSEQHIERLLAENRRLIASLFTSNEIQRRDLARDLHDELGQWLAAIQVNTRVVANYLASCDDTEVVDSARTIADSALEINHVIRDMVRMLRPPLLDTMGLQASLEDLVAHWQKYQTETRCALNVGGDIDHLPEALSISVYRILQEALANVTKHARASQVVVTVTRDADALLHIGVSDDGIGMATADPQHSDSRTTAGVGLLGIRERAAALGGHLKISAAQPHGSRLDLQLPIAAAELSS